MYRMIVHCEKTPTRELYRYLIGTVVPRPIAWVSTRSAQGHLNLAPFSFFNAFCADPPIIGFSPGYKFMRNGESVIKLPKDTLHNIKETEEFVVNIVTRPLAEAMNLSSGEYEYEVDEFEIAKLTPAPSEMVQPPRVAESPINMECKLHQIVELGGSALVLGRIVCMHIDDRVISGGYINPALVQPIGRLGGDWYCSVEDRFRMERPG